MPEPVTPPAPPKDIASIEMLYLAGMRLEQFYNPAVDPMIYYEEALRRDPDDLRVNTAVGILMLRKGMFEEAEKHLRKAVKRATWNYTHPRDTEPLYYHGLALRSLGRHKEAYDTLYEATWDDAFSSPGYFQLAEIAAQGGRLAEALRARGPFPRHERSRPRGAQPEGRSPAQVGPGGGVPEARLPDGLRGPSRLLVEKRGVPGAAGDEPDGRGRRDPRLAPEADAGRGELLLSSSPWTTAASAPGTRRWVSSIG